MSDPLDDLLALYPDLGPDERRAVDARVRAEHPGGLPPHEKARHDEARRFAALFDAARQNDEDGPADRRLDAVFGAGDAAALDGDDRAALEALLPADPLAHFRALDARVRAEHPDPFLAAPRSDAAEAATAAPASARAAERAGSRSRDRSGATAGDRASAPRAAWPRPTWARAYAFAAVAALLVGSLAVWRGMQPPLGDFSADDLTVQGYGTVRGGEPGAAETGTPPDQRYLQALDEIETARSTTLGLFVRYDRARLMAAQGLLEGVARDTSAGDFLHLEALYALGKTHVLLGDRAAATDALRQVVAGQGSRAREAEALLRTLHGGDPV